MGTLLFTFLLIFSDLKIETKDISTVNEGVYTVSAMAADEGTGELYLLDETVAKIAILDIKTNKVKVFGRKGQGPGEFLLPISLYLTKDSIFVGDMLKFHVFTRATLRHHKTIPSKNNCSGFAVYNNTILASLPDFPPSAHGAKILSFEGGIIKKFYSFKNEIISSTEKEISWADGYTKLFRDKFYILNYFFYEVQIFDTKGNFIEKLPVKWSPRYFEPASPDKFQKLQSATSVRRWKSQFSNPASIQIDSKGNIWICFYEYKPGTQDKTYYVDVYNADYKKLIDFKPIPGPLLASDKNVFGVYEGENLEDSNVIVFTATLQPTAPKAK